MRKRDVNHRSGRGAGQVATWLLVLACAACGATTSTYPWADEPDPRRTEYVVGVADQLDVRVWRNGELSTSIVVRPDGNITLPLIGSIRAAGLTPTQIQDDIGKRLLAYVTEEDAVVTVAVTAVNSYNVTVAGNVTTPGRFSSTEYLTVADAIALAGGPTRFAEPQATVVLRRNGDGEVRRIPIDYEQVIAGKGDVQNIVLLRGDVVHVP